MSNIGKGDCKVIKFYLNVLPNRILYSTNIVKTECKTQVYLKLCSRRILYSTNIAKQIGY